ncbi:phospholipase D [Rhizophagus irregularis DAOM 197198w]|uniref:Phospholipase n=1 Tax=Rhizophagus irregularis (strain DAOM 197198w) TaxID=1432141 RepID=A0A015KMQ4_RHIIW|nr:phospholipase D [Rhizophagus irregularis DAOM 197198w]EXX61012.1 phospholipase D [Rhizophagus irregularis DAOM 197198w]
MSDPLTSNDSKNDEIESSDNNILVQLSNKTLALLNQNKDDKNDSSTKNESDNEEDEQSYWQQSILSNIFNTKGNSKSQPRRRRNTDPNKQQRRRKSKPLENAPGPSDDQLSAPYIEEHHPEQPYFTRQRRQSEPPDSDLISEEAGPSNQIKQQLEEEKEEVKDTKTLFRSRVRKALAMSKINKMISSSDRKHLRDTGNLGVLTFPSPIIVPYLWARRDNKGHKAPFILFDALKLAITDSQKDENNYNVQTIFRIELEYGDVKWVIKRTGFDFVLLYFSLKQRNDLPFIPKIPSGLYRWFKSFFHSPQVRHELHQAAALERRNQLEDYLIKLIRTLNMHVSYELNEFLEIGAISITRDMGWKGKEGYYANKVDRFYTPMCSFRSSKWITEWVVVRDSYIAFNSHMSSLTPSDVFLLDKHFKCNKLTLQGTLDRVIKLKLHDHVSIENSSRRIELKGDSRKLNELLESIERITQSSPWIKQHRYDSYAPIRENVKVKWYVDGKDYFFAVSEAILAAKSEIYIEDWWLSPELYFRRPPSENEEFRLDRLLKRKAEEGVMIYIVVYKEVKYSLTLDSYHTKKSLQELHENIKVQRHPDHGPEGTMFWAHHEKIVVVDCRIAFIGGLDLCFGRYDTHNHELADWCPDNFKQPTIWPGQDYSNPRIKDFQNVVDYETSMVDKSQAPRMPWHDVGPPARDVARHFVQRWNFIKDEKAYDKDKFPFLTPKGEYVSTRDESKFRGTCDVQLLRSSAYWSSGIERESSIYNAYCHLIRTSKHFIYIENQFFITTTENEENDPKYVIKNRIGECIVERIKKAHENNEKFRIIVIMPLLPSFESDLNSSDAGTIRMVMHWQYMSICRGGKGILEKLSEAGINSEKYITFYSLRGYDKVHHVNNKGENKSLRSKKSLLSLKARREKQNQERSSEDNSTHLNEPTSIGEPVVLKHFTEEIYIHSKLMIVDDRYVIIGSANLNDRSQLGNRDSEIAIVIKDNKKVDARMNGKPYQASKFAYTLRSSLFKEHLGLLEIQDHSSITKSCLPPIKPDILYDLTVGEEKPFTSILDDPASFYPPKKPKHPTKEDLVVMDPLSEEFYDYWQSVAHNNTETYRSVFRCVPDDNVINWDQYKEFVPDPAKVPTGHVANSEATKEEIEEKLKNIRGHLVVFPTQFLSQENLFGSIISNAVTPFEIFT